MKLILSRLFQGLFILVVAMCIAFVMMYVIGDPVLMRVGPDASPERIEEYRVRHGYDRHLAVQFADYLGNALRGDFGVSFRHQVPVLPLMLYRFRRSAEVAVPAMIFAVFISIFVGVMSAVRRNTWFDYIVRTGALAGQAAPNFWVGIMGIVIFGVALGWLPTSGREVGEGMVVYLRHLIMPAFVLSLFPMAYLLRMMRSTVLEVLNEDYVRTAYSKGLAERVVIFKHVFRNALLPFITIATMQFGHIAAGSMVIESVYSWPGLGRLFMNAIRQLDVPVVAGALVFIAAIKIFMNLVADILYILTDPRIRYN